MAHSTLCRVRLTPFYIGSYIDNGTLSRRQCYEEPAAPGRFHYRHLFHLCSCRRRAASVSGCGSLRNAIQQSLLTDITHQRRPASSLSCKAALLRSANTIFARTLSSLGPLQPTSTRRISRMWPNGKAWSSGQRSAGWEVSNHRNRL